MKRLPIGRFIDPLTDFGFKLLFGTEPNKDLLIDFLNQVLEGQRQVKTLTYSKNEQAGNTKDTRKAIFDLHCTDENGSKFIIEVQKVAQEFFKDRSIYYTASLITGQGKKGGKWDFKLQDVYFIGLMDFEFDDSLKDKYLHEIALIDRHTGDLFYNKLGFTFIEIPKFNKTASELETGLDKWLFLLRNLSKLKKIPVILNKRIFSKLFTIAETGNLTKEEYHMYEASLMQKWDLQNAMDFAVKKARAEEQTKAEKLRAADKARAERLLSEAKKQIEKERSEKHQLLINLAKQLKKDGMDAQYISRVTNLPIEEIEKL